MTDRPRTRPVTAWVAGLAALVPLLTACPDGAAPPPLPTGTVIGVTPPEHGRVRVDVRYPGGDVAPAAVPAGSPCAVVGAEFPTCQE